MIHPDILLHQGWHMKKINLTQCEEGKIDRATFTIVKQESSCKKKNGLISVFERFCQWTYVQVQQRLQDNYVCKIFIIKHKALII